MVISTGMTLPRMDSVWALYALQKSMMLTPCGPRAVPTGGAGVAAPAWSWTLTSAAIFFFGGIALSLSSRGHDEGPDGPLPLRRVRSDAIGASGRGPVSPLGRHRSKSGSDLLDLAEAELDRS